MALRAPLDGVIPVLSMPFDDDEGIAVESLEREIDFLVDAGADTVAVGFGSEIIRLTDRELDQVTRSIVERAAGRAGVIAAVRAGSARAGAERAAAAAACGADAIMAAPPLGTAGEEQAVGFYGALAAAAGLPIVVQDAPAASGVDLAPAWLERIVNEVEGIAALKVEPVPSAAKISAVCERIGARVPILGGGGGLDFLHELRRGASGTMPGAALPELFLRVHRLHRDGDDDGAARCFQALLPVTAMSLRSPDTFLFVQKEILRRRGVLRSARLRAPGARPDRRVEEELDALLQAPLVAESLARAKGAM